MTIRPIRSDADYEAALEQARTMMLRGDERSLNDLEVLQAVVERWERQRPAMTAATPAEAIRFRMDQAGIRPRDLIPMLGSKSRVSEILSGQRQPTVDQIRALNRHLGIPVSSLIGSIRHEAPSKPSTASTAATAKLKALGAMRPKEELSGFVARAAGAAPAVAMLRKTRTDRTNAKTDYGALEAWCAAVLVASQGVQLPKGRRASLGLRQARDIARLSPFPDWRERLVTALGNVGVVLVTMDHLPGTFLDGAAILRGDGTPVIALTLRHDRLDNFWFTLLHEFAHVACHLSAETTVIVDDLEVGSPDGIEAEADRFARDALLPPELWESRSAADMSVADVVSVAGEARVHPAIVAGRWRWENGDYRRFSRLLGRGEVRQAFDAG